MLSSKVSTVVVVVAAVIFCFVNFSFSADSEGQKTYRIGYIEGGPYWIFSSELDAIKSALSDMGWKDRIDFLKDEYYSPGWNEDKKPELIESAQKLMSSKDLDLIVAAGTDAVAAILKVNNRQTPIVGISVSDAQKSGFILNESDSGVDNFTVRIVPNRFRRMFEIFHEMVGFKNLGLLYKNTEIGRTMTNYDDATLVAKELGFELIDYKNIKETGRNTEDTLNCLNGLKELVSQGMDAFFIPSLTCFDWKTSDVKMLLEYLNQNNIPTFARNGTRDVKAGALMGFSSVDFSDRGKFVADKIVKILQGEKPRSLAMVDNVTPKISINLHVAKQIGFNPDFEFLAVSNELFQEITLPEDRLVK